MAKKTNKKGIKLNFDGVETGYKAVPEGTYEVRVKEIEAGTSQANAPKLDFKFEIISGKNKGSLLFYTCSLQPQALFKLKVVLEALGYEIPEGNFNLDIDELIDLECSVEVAHETYEGKKRARIVEFITSDEDDSEDEDDDDSEDEDDDDSEEDEDEEDDEDEDEEDDEDEEEDDDEDEEEDDDEDEDEDEDEEDEVDYDSLSLKELKALAKEKGIKFDKKAKKDDIIALLQEEDDEDDEEDEEEDDTPDYESMNLKELKALCKERGIKVTKKDNKESLIEKLEEDDEDEE